ncbi:hypothetical protein F2Q69_00029624 [Brassica cretica]|uniref:Uncharacterized protein n=1 Tax=Brassica cretica TaxID=69181 RepID=A0A8S9S5C9_BRACR|nr:hypothetical protein F2Q69_00029624 [Brassica cretica]
MHGLMSYRRFGSARSLRSDRVERTLGRYVVTERNGRSVATLLGLSEEHPQSFGKVSFLEWFLQWNPKDTLKKIVHLHLISSPLQMLRNLFLSFPQAEGFGCGMSALIRAMSIFGKCTRNVRGACRSMGAGELGRYGCLAVNSLWVMILTALHDAADSVGVIDRCSGKLIDRL